MMAPIRAATAALALAAASTALAQPSSCAPAAGRHVALEGWVAPLLQNLIEVHERLLKVSDVKPPLHLCDIDRVNAFVIDRDKPVYVMTGLLKQFGHDKEALAAVLAHEFGHLVRDHAGYRSRALGAFVSNAVVAGRGRLQQSGNISDARNTARKEFARQFFAFSREQEKDADSYGTVLLTRAGFPPDAMIKAMQRLALIYGDKPTEWSSTHPGITDRLAVIEPRVQDEQRDQLARSLSGQQAWGALAQQIDSWLLRLPDSGNAWFHKAAFLERVRSPRAIEAYERALSSTGPAISRTDAELGELWLSLCIALYKAGYKEESVACSRRSSSRELRTRFQEATFGDNLVVAGEEPASSGLRTARDASGSKLITNDPVTLRARGITTSSTVEPWRPVRFPPTGIDQPLQGR